MTNEERQKLCDKLRIYGKSSFHGGRACKDAADEIERLAKEVEELESALMNPRRGFAVREKIRARQ
jgi:hypothetical protein